MSDIESASHGVTKDVAHERERWSSRLAFYFAAIGSAVGFGNVWRFPSLVYEYGGAAFLLPYFLALFLVGLPILVLEISLGQYYETGGKIRLNIAIHSFAKLVPIQQHLVQLFLSDVDVFGGIHRRLRGVGLSSVACGLMLVTYYSMLIAWALHAFFDTFSADSIWHQEETVTTDQAKEYFDNEILGINTVGEDMLPTRIVWSNAGYSLLTWIIVFLCIAWGIKTTGRITYFTLGFPVLMLFVFLGRSVTLEGSSDGINKYLTPDFSTLMEHPEVWPKAVSQIFFSLSVTFGIMTAYGSHCKRDEPALVNSCVIALSNSLFSFIAGFAVFAALGHLAWYQNVNIEDLDIAGFGLVFSSWPVILGMLPAGIHWIRLLFFMLFTLGIDSAFSFNEGFLIVLCDTALFKGVAKWKISAVITILSFLFSLIYATDAGYYFLDTMDYYINFVMILVGAFECFSAGWIYNIEEQIDALGAQIVFTNIIATFGSVTFACILWFNLESDSAVWAGFLGFLLFYAIGMLYTVYLMRKKIQAESLGSWALRSMVYDLLFRNMMDLREDLSSIVGPLPIVWAVLVKFFIPPILIVLFALGCDAKNEVTGEKIFGHYGGFPTAPYQVLGVLTVTFALFILLSSLAVPRIYEVFTKQDSPVPPKSNPNTTLLMGPSTMHSDSDASDRDDHIFRATSHEGVWPPQA